MPRDVQPVEPGAFDAWAIAMVLTLRHRHGRRHSCRCEECRAIKRVCALAREAGAMKAARRKRPRPPRTFGHVATVDPAVYPELVG